MLIIDGFFGRWCTGTMIANTNEDETPYLISANHCLFTIGGSELDLTAWVFVFDYYSPSCMNDIDGELVRSISGAELISSSDSTDFALLKLKGIPDSTWEIPYAGWSLQKSSGQSYSIHHPSGDVKKISFDNDPIIEEYLETEKLHAWKVYWDEGTTELGSSGSALFNEDNLFIGQLYGGNAKCSGRYPDGQEDYYGQFYKSWDFENGMNKQVASWLDPKGIINETVREQAGYIPNSLVNVLPSKKLKKELFAYYDVQTNELKIKQNNIDFIEGELDLINSLGQSCSSIKLDYFQEYTLNVSSLSRGVYILNCRLDNGRIDVIKISIY